MSAAFPCAAQVSQVHNPRKVRVGTKGPNLGCIFSLPYFLLMSLSWRWPRSIPRSPLGNQLLVLKGSARGGGQVGGKGSRDIAISAEPGVRVSSITIKMCCWQLSQSHPGNNVSSAHPYNFSYTLIKCQLLHRVLL